MFISPLSSAYCSLLLLFQKILSESESEKSLLQTLNYKFENATIDFYRYVFSLTFFNENKKAVIEEFKNKFANAHTTESKARVAYAMKSYFRALQLSDKNYGLSRSARDERSKEWLIAAGFSPEESLKLVQLGFSFATFDETYLSAVESSISKETFGKLKKMMG